MGSELSITFTINGKTFAANAVPDTSTNAARIALACAVDSPVYQLIRFHVPGTDGNLIVRGGRTGQAIRVRVRYIGALSGTTGNAETLFASDQSDWANAAVTIVDHNGVTHDNCNLLPGSFRRTSVPKPTGRTSGQGWFDCEAEFTID